MNTIKSYKDLEVWKKGIELVKRVYVITKKFPKVEVYGLASQMRRSAVSISSNIAEGKMRQYPNEYVQFLYVALGSCGELDTQLIIAEQLGYVSKEKTSNLTDEIDHISRMLRNLIKTIRK